MKKCAITPKQRSTRGTTYEIPSPKFQQPSMLKRDDKTSLYLKKKI